MIEHIHKQISVPREYHCQRVDRVIAQLLPEYSRSQISQWIKTGAITINQKAAKPKDKALANDLIEVNVNFTPIDTDFTSCKPEDIPLDIVFEDNDLIVLNKAAGMVVHPGAGNREHTLVNALLHHAPSLHHLPRAGIIHRLDKDTTGLLLVAKTLTAHTSLIRQMQNRTIQRHYITLVQGHVLSGGIIETCFGRHPRNRLKMAVIEQGREAITHYKVNKHYDNYTLLNVRLMTGRTHQIRVHLAHINHPLVGDPLYGSRMRVSNNTNIHLKNLLQQFKRQALHACTISFEHPKSNREITLEAPLPDDFQILLTALEQHEEH